MSISDKKRSNVEHVNANTGFFEKTRKRFTFLDHLDFGPEMMHPEPGGGEKLTEPGQTLTIQQIYERHMPQPMDFYEMSHDDDDLSQAVRSDIYDRESLKTKTRTRLEQMERELEAEKQAGVEASEANKGGTTA